ncbi:MAG: MarR family winged helix-turn-helix transcriptional regulator [Clostridiales bacterium]|nr:MarR family winged helix-turn-helix transcriptional regulator [Clostridiales bacterium]
METQLNNLMPLIKMNVGKLEKDMNHDLMQYGITCSQARVIFVLYDSPNGILSMKELEKRFQVTQQTMLGIVKRLENKNLVERCSEPQDTRTKRIRLTADGAALGENVCKSFCQTQVKIDQALTEKEQDTLRVLLNKLYISIA